MRKALLAALALLLILPTLSCDNGGGGGGGTTANSTSVVDSNWVNAKGREVPYDLFGLSNVSAGRGRGLPEGLTVTMGTPPAHGTLSKSNTHYTPKAGYVGKDSFTFKLTDASGAVHPQLYTLTFTRVDADPPMDINPGHTAIFPNNVNAASNQKFFAIRFASDSELLMKVRYSLLSAPSGKQPSAQGYKRTIVRAGLTENTFSFYGDFTGCTTPGTWYFTLDTTFTDPAGNPAAGFYPQVFTGSIN